MGLSAYIVHIELPVVCWWLTSTINIKVILRTRLSWQSIALTTELNKSGKNILQKNWSLVTLSGLSEEKRAKCGQKHAKNYTNSPLFYAENDYWLVLKHCTNYFLCDFQPSWSSGARTCCRDSNWITGWYSAPSTSTQLLCRWQYPTGIQWRYFSAAGIWEIGLILLHV